MNNTIGTLDEFRVFKERLAKYPFIEMKGYGFELTRPSEWVMEFEMNRPAAEFLHRLFLEVNHIGSSSKTHGIKLGYVIQSSDTDRLIQLNIRPQSDCGRITKGGIRTYLTALIRAIDIVDMEQCGSKSELSGVQPIQSVALTAIDTLWFHRPLKHVNSRPSLSTRRNALNTLLDTKFVTIGYFHQLAKTKLGYMKLMYDLPLHRTDAIVAWLSGRSTSKPMGVDDHYYALVVQMTYNGYKVVPGLKVDESDYIRSMVGRSVIDHDYPWGWDLTMSAEQHAWILLQFGAKLDPEYVYEVAHHLDKAHNPEHWKKNL